MSYSMNSPADAPAPWDDLVEWSRDAVVLDLSTPSSPDLARQIGPRVARFLQPERGMDLERTLAPLVDQYADLVLLCPPDPAITDARTAIAALKRVLRSGGRVLMELPCTSQSPKIDWRSALESERIWVDEDGQYTQIDSAAEYMEGSSVNLDEKDANCVQPCYRRLSGIK